MFQLISMLQAAYDKWNEKGNEEMLTKRKKTLTLFIVSAFLNLFLFLFAYFLKLPMWLDTTGTIYITLLLDFPAGFLVGLINNVILSLFFYGFDSISYYLVSATLAFGTSLYLKYRVKRGKPLNFTFAFSLLSIIFFISICLAIPLTLLVDKGIPSDYWGQQLYATFVSNNMNSIVSTALSTSMIKLIDVIATIAIVMLALRITPKRFKNEEYLIW